MFSGSVFLAAKFNAEKKIAEKISCGKNSGDKISSGEIGRSENNMRRNLNAVKIPRGEISGGRFPTDLLKKKNLFDQ